MYRFDFLIFIGRFQPFHLAHLQTIEIALNQAHQVIICLGSAQNERSLKNPFLASERKKMILSNFSLVKQQRLQFISIVDVYDDKKWQTSIVQQVQQYTQDTSQIGLIGHMKDESSYYLDLFPAWEKVPIESLCDAISATPIRMAYYQGDIIRSALPQGTIEFLEHFQNSQPYQQLQHIFQEQSKS